jgi:hypothetical protein
MYLFTGCTDTTLAQCKGLAGAVIAESRPGPRTMDSNLRAMLPSTSVYTKCKLLPCVSTGGPRIAASRRLSLVSVTLSIYFAATKTMITL